MPRITLKKEFELFEFTIELEKAETVADVLCHLRSVSKVLDGQSSALFLSEYSGGPLLSASTPLSSLATLNGTIQLYIRALPPRGDQQVRIPGIVKSNVQDDLRFVILISPTLEDGYFDNWILRIPSDGVKWHWSRISLFLSIVSSRYEQGKYKFINQETCAEIPISEDLYIPGGRYAILPRDDSDPPLVVDKKGCDIIPRHRKKSMVKPTAYARRFTSLDEETIDAKMREFKESVLIRDNHCVITKRRDLVNAIPILSWSWKYQVDKLPGRIIKHPNEFYSARNGILLQCNLSEAYENGKISFRYVNEYDLEVVVLDPYFAEYDGMLVDTNDRVRSDGKTWWETDRPLRVLVDFHLQNAIFQTFEAGKSLQG